MVFRLYDEQVGFPDPRLSEEDGFLAFGGGMSPDWLLNAYYMGIFPWYDDGGGNPYWYSPDPRMLLFPGEFHCSKSLRRTISSNRFELRVDTCFRDVINSCASVKRSDQDAGSWISDRFVDAYCRMHDMGFAHSFESFLDGKLVGGLYGIGLSDYFCGESMFHTVSDASKVAFARMVEFAQLHGFRFVDAQMYTRHLASLGAREVTREDFLQLLEQQDINKSYVGRWKNNSAVLLLGGNQGDRVSTLMRAISEIGKSIGTVSLISSIYETEPWGFDADQNFLNQALVVDTDLSAHEVLAQALAIEKDLGRIREPESVSPAPGSCRPEKEYSSRPIDIDVIFFNSELVDIVDLQLPHPRMHLRRFVLTPLEEIIPDYQHPKFHKTIRQLLEDCEDSGLVQKYF